MAPDPTLELSITKLIDALDKRLLTEYAQAQSAVLSVSSRALATMLANQVQSQKLRGGSRVLMIYNQVDTLERHAKEVLREIPTLRNSLQPANSLPPELLTHCATLVSDTDPRPIITMTHVCRYWRNAISANPRNWASLSRGWKRLAPLCLQRAQEAPLVIDIAVSDDKEERDFLKSLLPNVLRIGSLRLTKYSSVEAVAGDLPGFFNSPMPNLVSLELQQLVSPAQVFPSNGTSTPPVFQNVRALKSLRLTRTPIYRTLFNISSLVELKLSGYTTPFDFETFVQFLNSNTGLQFIELDIQFVVGSVRTTPAQEVPLRHLRHLSITCSRPIDSKGLLSSISLPLAVRLEISFTKLLERPEPTSFLPSPLKHIRRSLGPITTIKSRYTPPALHLSGSNSSLSWTALGQPPKLFVGFTLFPTVSVRELHINIHPVPLTPKCLSWVLRRLPVLETLAISETLILPGGLSALIQEPVLCPSLKTFAFSNCNITETVVEELGEVVAKRRDLLTSHLSRVVIVSSTPTPLNSRVIRQLQRLVPHVEVMVGDKLPDFS